ncbi:MAG: methyltransferase family protein [Flavisolibacter sp.]
MIASHIILALLWIVYCVLHSLLASVGIKMGLQKKLKHNYKYYRLFYTVFAFLFLIMLLYYQISLHTTQLYAATAMVLITGVVLGFCGLVLMIICIKKYFIGLSGLLSLFKENTSQDLIITGVHKYVRHPLYLGTFAFIWGLFLILPYLSLFIANAIITIYTLIGIKFEEDKLVNEFGESYKLYQQRVPMIIPFTKTQQLF